MKRKTIHCYAATDITKMCGTKAERTFFYAKEPERHDKPESIVWIGGFLIGNDLMPEQVSPQKPRKIRITVTFED